MTEPFVLLDGGAGSVSRLYRSPTKTISARVIHDVLPALDELGHKDGEWAGYLGYEAGLALEPRLAPLATQRRDASSGALLWFAQFERCAKLTPDEISIWLNQTSQVEAELGPLTPEIAFQDYAAAFASIAGAIQAGDIYQANLTFALSGSWRGCPVALYAGIRARAGAGHGALVFDGQRWILSFSPELFFRKDGVTLHARPMKGTAPRGACAEQDLALARGLSASVKDRAENLMIVDLLRNDLSRIAQPGSVRVDKLFTIETYPTVHQMTSSIQAQTSPGTSLTDMLRALFPCGSITGAPKIRAMELIHAIENRDRGMYCGSIGRIAPQGDIDLNVAIRTLELDPFTGMARMGVGSAVVADSVAMEEWQECLVKARFLTDLSR